MGSCMSTPSSDEPKRTPESSTKQPTTTSTTPAPTQANGTSPADTTGQTATTSPNSQTPQQPNGNGLNGRSSLGPASAQDRGSDAQAISAALASTEGSIEKRGSKDRSNAIDKQLEDDQRKFKKECKILLLGES